MEKANNLWQLLMQHEDRVPLMIACGVTQATLEQGSDYDRFRAYADCMPLCQGHGFLARDAQLIRKLLSKEIPICPESCDALWHAAACALTGLGEMPDLPDHCAVTYISPKRAAAKALDLEDAIYAAPTAELLTRLTDAKAVSVNVSVNSFAKPNPYAAKQLLAKYERGEVLTQAERDLLSAQTLRVLGKLCADRKLTLYIRADFINDRALCALLQYLYHSSCLPPVVLVVSDRDALHAAARTVGCVPNLTDTPQIRVGVTDAALLDLYATLLPIGVLPI